MRHAPAQAGQGGPCTGAFIAGEFVRFTSYLGSFVTVKREIVEKKGGKGLLGGSDTTRDKFSTAGKETRGQDPQQRRAPYEENS